MAAQEQSLAKYFDSETAKILGACTACGKCVEICPVVPYAGLKDADPKAVAHGVVDFLAQRARLAGASASFAHTCNGCGECIPACPEGVNPRKMLVLANTMHAGERTQTPQLFRKVSRAIRLMAGMQLLPAEFARVLNPPHRTQAPIVFYLGCNALRTPHLLFNAMYVLDALGTDYEVEQSDVGAVMLCGGAQDRRVCPQLVLRMDGHRAAQRRTHPNNSHTAIADLKLAAEPRVLDETVRFGAGIQVDVGTKAARIEIRRAESAQMFQRVARQYVQDILVVEIARRQESAALGDLLDFRHREWRVAARPLQAYRMLE